ncbi:hypothetical protein CEXT_87061 [Caerostris extrusa]|uniref:Uncharacterized protein n=1 Tax=Caerostris extrusa TaxID=172846 RepID=A0AAV4NVI5_CAEEX|nr:hypothetical protein CEXT_87061 [Caerostris extrusa]
MLSRKRASHCLRVPNREPGDLSFRVEERKNAMAPNETTFERRELIPRLLEEGVFQEERGSECLWNTVLFIPCNEKDLMYSQVEGPGMNMEIRLEYSGRVSC